MIFVLYLLCGASSILFSVLLFWLALELDSLSER